MSGGELIGCQVAMFLAAQGSDVTLVGYGHSDLFTDDGREFAFDVVGEIVRPLLLERLADAVTLVPKRAVKRVEEGQSGVGPPRCLPAAPLVGSNWARRRERNRGRQRGAGDPASARGRSVERLAARAMESLLVGDAVEPRTVYEAVAEGSAAGRSVGGERVYPTMSVGEAAVA